MENSPRKVYMWRCPSCGDLCDDRFEAAHCCADDIPAETWWQCMGCGKTHYSVVDAVRCCTPRICEIRDNVMTCPICKKTEVVVVGRLDELRTVEYDAESEGWHWVVQEQEMLKDRQVACPGCGARDLALPDIEIVW